MIDYALLLLSLALFVPFFIFGYSYHLYKVIRFNHSFSMRKYSSNVSYQMDCVGCALVYNVRGHTLSAMAHERGHWWFEYLINLLFWDRDHCINEWKKEFRGDGYE